MSEFTGKQKDIFRVRVILERQRQVEHVAEGWINMPGDKPETMNVSTLVTGDESTAMAAFKRICNLPTEEK